MCRGAPVVTLSGMTPRARTDRRPRRQLRLRHSLLLAAGILALGVSVAACGGPSNPGAATGSTNTPASSSGAGGTQGAGLVAYSSCMRSHGVANFPDPSPKGGIPKQGVVSALRAVSSAQAQTAQNACEHLLGSGGSLSGKPVQTITAQDQQDYLNAAACMRSHGITGFPDPAFSNGQVSLNIPSSVDTSSTQFTHAEQICTKLIPAGLPYSHG